MSLPLASPYITLAKIYQSQRTTMRPTVELILGPLGRASRIERTLRHCRGGVLIGRPIYAEWGECRRTSQIS
jgi:hypothetical protein